MSTALLRRVTEFMAQKTTMHSQSIMLRSGVISRTKKEAATRKRICSFLWAVTKAVLLQSPLFSLVRVLRKAGKWTCGLVEGGKDFDAMNVRSGDRVRNGDFSKRADKEFCIVVAKSSPLDLFRRKLPWVNSSRPTSFGWVHQVGDIQVVVGV